MGKDEWTPAEVLKFRETYIPPLAMTSAVLLFISLVIFYSFPKLRQFPASILSWVNYCNLLFSVYIFWKWYPGSALHHSWAVKIVPNGIPCRLSLFLDTFQLTGVCAANTLLALTIFLAVRCLTPVGQDRRYFYGYVAFMWIYPGTVSLYTAVGGGTYIPGVGQTCNADSTVSQVVLRIPFFVALVVQLILYVYTLYYMKRTIRGVNSTSVRSVDANWSYLMVRFLATYIAEIYNCLPDQVSKLLWKTTLSPTMQRFVFISHVSGSIIDALILIIGNTEFRNWVYVEASSLYRKYWKKHAPPSPDQLDVEARSDSSSKTSSMSELLASANNSPEEPTRVVSEYEIV